MKGSIWDTDSLDKIHLTWIAAWAIDGRRDFWGQSIEKENFKMYMELHSQWDGECAREMLNNYRKYIFVNMEITEEIERATLLQRNEDFEDEEERIMEARERTSMVG